MSGSDRIRLGVVGAGFIGRVHLTNFAGRAEVELAGITDFLEPLARRAAEEYKVKRVYDSAEQMIDADEIDAVVIGVPNRHHAALAIRALANGKHVLLEKPMARSSAEARKIVEEHEKSGRVLMMAHQQRWNWASRYVKEHVGELGRIYNAKTGWWRRKGIPGWGSWFTRKEESGGGPLIDIGVHMLDLALWLMGNPRPVAVFGATFAEFGPRKRGIGTWGTPEWDGVFDVEDLATALIRMQDGSCLTLEVSWAAHTAQEGGFVHLMGADGGASLQGDRVVFTGQGFGRTFDVEANPPSGYEGSRPLLSRHFVECIREGKEPITSARSGLVNNTILDAIYESSRTGRLVEIKGLP